MADTNGGITLPRYILWIGGIAGAVLLGVVLPWGTWVTVNQIQSASNTAAIADLQTKVGQLNETDSRHTAELAVMNATRFTSGHGETLRQGIESRIDRMETKFDAKLEQLQRDFDRAFGKAGMQ